MDEEKKPAISIKKSTLCKLPFAPIRLKCSLKFRCKRGFASCLRFGDGHGVYLRPLESAWESVSPQQLEPTNRVPATHLPPRNYPQGLALRSAWSTSAIPVRSSLSASLRTARNSSPAAP